MEKCLSLLRCHCTVITGKCQYLNETSNGNPPPLSTPPSTHQPNLYSWSASMTGLVTTSFHRSYTASMPPWAVGCRLAENPAPGNRLRKGKAPALVGQAGCCHTKKKNQYCWWKASTSCSALPRHWLLLSFFISCSRTGFKGLLRQLLALIQG